MKGQGHTEKEKKKGAISMYVCIIMHVYVYNTHSDDERTWDVFMHVCTCMHT